MIPLIIPSYEPDERLLQLLNTLRDYPFGPVLLVNDGSGPVYQTFFDRAKELLQEKLILLSHEVNRGKGRALKTAFAYVLEHFPDAAGCVTADSDGQHSAAAIESIAQGLGKHPESLILGMRTFDGDDIPWKSRFGNTITMSVFSYIAGTKVHDTQTGLRGIPLGLRKCLAFPMTGSSSKCRCCWMHLPIIRFLSFRLRPFMIPKRIIRPISGRFRIRRKFMLSWERDFSNIPWHRFLRASLICCCLRFCVISCVTVWPVMLHYARCLPGSFLQHTIMRLIIRWYSKAGKIPVKQHWNMHCLRLCR